MLQVRQGLGDQPFRIISTELKVDITSVSLREAFFQCVQRHMNVEYIAGVEDCEWVTPKKEGGPQGRRYASFS